MAAYLLKNVNINKFYFAYNYKYIHKFHKLFVIQITVIRCIRITIYTGK